MRRSTAAAMLASITIGALPASPLLAGPRTGTIDTAVHDTVWEDARGTIRAGDHDFASWSHYFQSDYFKQHGNRCGAPEASHTDGPPPRNGAADCTTGYTNPSGEYDPSTGAFRIPVVVHVITRTNGTGNISDAMVQSQIDVLNEDFLALGGSLGGPGTDCNIEFYLAATDPDGQATNGITRSASNSWYNDHGNYKNALAWDTHRYLNIYTNTAGGYLGYAYIPNSGGVVGNNIDGVVINWQAFGRNSQLDPYDLGRTATHEVGHYLGLYHTFQGGCASTSGCASNGDLICDTNPESGPNYSGCWRSTCGSSDPVKNYMDYSEDLCMDNFTHIQARRMRCTMQNWRPDLWSWDGGGGSAPTGSCCLGSSCSEVTETDCNAIGGSWLGDDTTCQGNPCGGGGQGADALLIGALIQVGTNVGGTAADMAHSDDDYLSIDASQSGSKYECMVDVSFIAASTTATRIDVRTEMGASISGARTTVYAFDFNSGRWDRIIRDRQSTADAVLEATDIASPSDYIDSSTGEMHIRIHTLMRHADLILHIDEVNVFVMP